MSLGFYPDEIRKHIHGRKTTRTMSVCNVILVLILTWVVTAARCQRLPTRDEEFFIHQMKNPETFQDTHLVPDGAEVKAYAWTGQVSRYYFLVEEDSTSLSITVTPCDSQLYWILSIHDVPEEGSASGTPDQLEQQRRVSPPPTGSILKRYIGNNINTYAMNNSPDGIYMLEVRAIKQNSSFTIYATTTPESDRIYPILPTDARVDITSVRKNSISLAWKASLSDTIYKQPIIYCVAVNTQRNYPTLCSIESRLYGDRQQVVPNVGFGFSNENTQNKQSRKNKKRKSRRKFQQNKRNDSDITLECIGTKTMYTFTDLEMNQEYFFDVFAVDTTTNRSTSYIGTHVVTRPADNEPKVVTLKDGKIMDSSVRQSKPAKIFQINAGEMSNELLITVQPCSGTAHVEIWKGNMKVKDAEVQDLRSFSISNAEGIYHIKVTGTRKLTTHFRIFATTKPMKYPYPRMPHNDRIKVFRNLRECDSITLGWLTTDETAQYCLYKRIDKTPRDEHYGTKHPRLENQCHGPALRKKNEKVLCRKVHAFSGQNTVMTATVTDLAPGTDYVFDVYVSGDGKQSLAYRSVKVKTKKTC